MRTKTVRLSIIVSALAVAAAATASPASSLSTDEASAPADLSMDAGYAHYSAIQDPGASAPDYFQPPWYDTDGRHIQAHGGQIVTATEDGRKVYYWYGEDRSNGYWNSPGISVYKSYDTMNWTNEGTALKTVTKPEELTSPYFDALYDTVDQNGEPDTDRVQDLNYYLNSDRAADYTAIFERPKVLYNAKNQNWVMWWHADGRTRPGGSTYARSMAAVAVSDSPTGPFKMVGAYRMYNRTNYRQCQQSAVPGQARDMTVFQDADGEAYIVYSSEENISLYVAKLNDDFTNVEHTTTQDPIGIQYSASGEYPYIFADGTAEAPVRGTDFQIVKECGLLEAPAVFTHAGKYYVIASGATGWAPNSQTYYTADSILGRYIRGVEPADPYENVAYSSIPEGGDGRLAIGDTRKTTFGSQSTNVLTLGAGRYVYMGDRWNAGAADSTYVWLPMTVGENGRLQMRNPAAEDPDRWGSGWTPSYWADKGTGPGTWSVSEDRLPKTVRRGEDMSATLPKSVAVAVGGRTSETAVTWDRSTFTTLGKQTITGTLAPGDGFGPGRTFTRVIDVYAPGLANVAGQSTPSASSRPELVGTTIDGDLSGKGWDDWSPAGHPRNSWLSYRWTAGQDLDTIVVHTYKDGARATWPSRISVQYLDGSGAWVDSGVAANLEQSAAIDAPVVSLDVSGLPPTDGVRLVLTSEENTWQSISEVEIYATSNS